MSEVVEIRKRDIGADFIKFAATLLVLNSHMGICYGDYSMLATGGAIGDALFFFVSGFTLFMSSRKLDFVNWYKRRLGRIYPTILAMGLIAGLIFCDKAGYIEVMMADRYWFLQCILVCYLVLYPIIKYDLKMSICIPVSFLIMIAAFFLLFDFNGQLFYGQDTYFRWIFYFSIMMAGGGCSKCRNSLVYRWWHIPALLGCIAVWYGIVNVSKGGNLSILSYIPLVGVCVFTYLVGKAPWMEQLFDTKVIGNILFIVGGLCLDSYVVQFDILESVSDKLNGIFPLNIPIIMIAVLVAAYLLHMLSNVISQIFDSKPFDWRQMFLYKK